jgi:hypothetical protein
MVSIHEKTQMKPKAMVLLKNSFEILLKIFFLVSKQLHQMKKALSPLMQIQQEKKKKKIQILRLSIFFQLI